MTFTADIRKTADNIWQGSFDYPFIQELKAGKLAPEVFRFYLIQDHYYLKHFSKLFGLIAEKTTNPKIKQAMKQHQENLVTGEAIVREKFFQQLEITDDEIKNTPIAPTAYNYVSHMYRQLEAPTLEPAVAGIFPCSWLYQEIGAKLKPAGSPNPMYQDFIDTYAGEEFAQEIIKERAILDELYEQATPQIQDQMRSAFLISSQMEYLFWDMAYHQEKWPFVAGTIAK